MSSILHAPSKTWLLTAGMSALLVCGGAACAQDEDIKRMAEQARALAGQARANEDVKRVLEASGDKAGSLSLEEAQAITEKARQALKTPRQFQGYSLGATDALKGGKNKRAQLEKALYSGERTYLFVSQSMGEKALRRLIRHYAGRKDIVLVLRGMNRDQSLDKLFRVLYRLRKDIPNPPPVVMESRLFDVFDVKSVPVLIRVTKGTAASPDEVARREIARVAGLDDDTWLMERIQSGDRGDLGKRGPVQPISELSLMELVKLRASKIDWNKKKREAFKRAWRNIEIMPLTPAPRSLIRTVSAEVVATADIKDSKGRTLIHKGQKANQLEVRPWHGAVVVFDPTNSKEMEWVTKHRDDIEARFKPVKYLITNIDRADGWNAYRKLSDRLNRHLYVLVPDLAARFQLTHTISIVHADNKKKVFLVSEVKP